VGTINIFKFKRISPKQILGGADAASCNEHRAGSAPNFSANHNVIKEGTVHSGVAKWFVVRGE